MLRSAVTSPFWPLPALPLVATVALACRDTPSPADPSPWQSIRAPVRFHLLRSDRVPALDATIAASAIHALVAGANEIWGQAGVVWRVESVVRETARHERRFARLLDGEAEDTVAVLLAVIPRERLLADGWNVFVIRDLGKLAGGVYISFAEAQVAIVSEHGPGGPQTPAGSGPRILAHELGHALGLDHVACSAADNLMASGCDPAVRTRITAVQAQLARRQVRAGVPFVADRGVAHRDRMR